MPKTGAVKRPTISWYARDIPLYLKSEADALFDALESRLNSVLDRESATIARYDAKLDAMDKRDEMRVERIRVLEDALDRCVRSRNDFAAESGWHQRSAQHFIEMAAGGNVAAALSNQPMKEEL